jgi:hypothetical protein
MGNVTSALSKNVQVIGHEAVGVQVERRRCGSEFEATSTPLYPSQFGEHPLAVVCRESQVVGVTPSVIEFC